MEIVKKSNRSAGFTLVELCVVLAITAIVVTMVVTSVVFFTKQNNEIKSDASNISEITNAQKIIHEWIKSYDRKGYDIRPSDDQTKLVVYQGDDTVDTLFFEDRKILINGTESAQDFIDITSISFSKTASESQQLIQANLSFGEEDDEKQVLLFAVYSGMTRDRNVIGRNG